jgi:hypothetical protein
MSKKTFSEMLFDIYLYDKAKMQQGALQCTHPAVATERDYNDCNWENRPIATGRN